VRLYNLNGRLMSKDVTRYLIDWEAESKSKLQRKVKEFLYPYWANHVVYEEFPVFGSRMKVDIFNATYKIAIEVNGQQHSSYNSFFHNKNRENFLYSIRRDTAKRKWAELNEFKFIEIEYDEVNNLTKEWFEEKFGVFL